MQWTVINNTGSIITLDDVGQEIPASGTLNIDPASYGIWASSAISGDVYTNINSGDMSLTDGNNTLNGVRALFAIRFFNPYTFTVEKIELSEEMYIEENRQYIVSENITNDGTIIIDGSLTVI